jgi:hypothetical protein
MLDNFFAPVSAHGFRWPRGFAGELLATKTGAVTLFNTAQYINSAGFTGTYAGGDNNAKGTQLLYLFRNPLRAAVILTTINTPATYNVYFTNGTLSWTPPASNFNVAFPMAYAVAASLNNTPHTKYLYTGGLEADRDAAFFWLGVGDRLDVACAGTGTPNDYFSLAVVDQPGLEGTQFSAVGTPSHVTTFTTTSFTSAAPGYYTLHYVTAAASVSWAYTANVVVAAGDVLSHIPIPYAQEHAASLRDIRLLSSSMLISNVASEMNVEGSIYGCVVSDSTPFYQVNKPTIMTTKNDQFEGRAKKGLYTWLRPGGSNVFKYRNAMATSNGHVIDTNFSLDDGCSYQAMSIFVTGQVSTYPALDFLVAMAFSLEFHSDDPWIELSYPSMTAAEADRCLEVAIRATSFSENPLHLSDIRAFVIKAGKFLRQHSVLIGGTLSAMFPGGSGLIGPISRAIQS